MVEDRDKTMMRTKVKAIVCVGKELSREEGAVAVKDEGISVLGTGL